jgi:hypothetical protein
MKDAVDEEEGAMPSPSKRVRIENSQTIGF